MAIPAYGGLSYAWEPYGQAIAHGGGGISAVARSGIGLWAPGITRTSGATEIAAAGNDGSLWFYWAANGTTTWHPEKVAAQGTPASAPAMVASGNAIEIAANGP